jgi:hypothetical protein
MSFMGNGDFLLKIQSVASLIYVPHSNKLVQMQYTVISTIDQMHHGCYRFC